MDTATAAGFRALRRLEFGMAFPRAVIFPLGVPGPMGTVLAWAFIALYVVAGITVCAVARGMGLEWQPHTPLPHLILFGTLWGLAGLIPLAGALLAGTGLGGVAWFTQYQPQLHLKPLVDVLPLTERETFAARAQGRALAFGVYLLAGVLLGLLTRQLMLTLGLVRQDPGLLDAWHVAAVEAFAALLLGGVYVKAATRRLDMPGGMALFAAYTVPLYFGIFFGPVRHLFVFGQWNITVGATLIFGHVVLTSALAHLLYNRWQRNAAQRELRPTPDKAESPLTRPRMVDIQGAASIMEFETAEASDLPRLFRRAAVFCGQVAVWTTLVLVVIQTTILVCGAVYTAVHGLPELPPEVRDSPGMVLGFALLMLAMAVAVALPIGAWGEQMPMGGSFARHMRRPGVAGSHVSSLLPVPPRRRWWRRLAWLLTADVALGIGGLAACVVVRAADQLLPFAQDLPTPSHFTGVRLLVPAGVAFAASVLLFAYGALLRQADRTVQVSGCLVMGLFYLGAIGGIGLTISQDRDPSLLLPVLALVWMGLVLIVSLAAMEPSFWPRRPDGSRSLRTTLQAVAITLSVPVTIGLGTRLFMALVMGGMG